MWDGGRRSRCGGAATRATGALLASVSGDIVVVADRTDFGTETAMSSGLVIEDVTKRFGGVQALDGVSFRVGHGETVTLLGPNGAGKSTLLRIIATTVLPDSGRVFVDGHDAIARPAVARRSLGVALGDERSWYWRLTGRRNLEFFAALYGLTRRQAAERATELLAEVGLTEAADRRFDGYSTG